MRGMYLKVDQLKLQKEAVLAAKQKGMEGLKGLLRAKTAKLLRLSEQDIQNMAILRESIDARKKPEIYFIYSVGFDTKAENAKKILGGKSGSGKSLGRKSAGGKYEEAKRDGKAVTRNVNGAQVSLGAQVEFHFPANGTKPLKHPIVIVGMGPAGLFCGYFLAKQGYRPLILERGKCVEERQVDVERFWETGVLDTCSNVQFGEGGAGAFSDGKLNTLVKDKDGRNRAVLQAFVDCGAGEEILYEAKPHIGTDVLCKVVRKMREEIQRLGGEVRFQSQVTELLVQGGQICGVMVNSRAINGGTINAGTANGVTVDGQGMDGGAVDGQGMDGVTVDGRGMDGEAVDGQGMDGGAVDDGTVNVEETERIPCEQVILAVGHSARDTFQMLYEKQIPMEAKAFAVGLRVEHSQSMIDADQYGIGENLGGRDNGRLAAAPYKVTAQADNGRGVYSFCMCPGGYVVNASSEEGRLAVNGMSYSGRNGRNANSAIIVSVTPKDYGSEHPLAGIEFQRSLEQKAYALAEGRIPMQRYGVFRACVEQGRTQEELTEAFGKSVDIDTGMFLEDNAECGIFPEHKGQSAWADVSRILPEECNKAFVQCMEQFGRKIKGFDRADTILSGVESRTSSPLRITRDETLQSVVQGLYPCGEGAGYAGGITSAAMDGLRVAERIVMTYAKPG